jgi:hypothetical protein
MRMAFSPLARGFFENFGWLRRNAANAGSEDQPVKLCEVVGTIVETSLARQCLGGQNQISLLLADLPMGAAWERIHSPVRDRFLESEFQWEKCCEFLRLA